MASLVRSYMSNDGQLRKCNAKLNCPLGDDAVHVDMPAKMVKEYNSLAVEESEGGVFGEGLSEESQENFNRLKNHVDTVAHVELGESIARMDQEKRSVLNQQYSGKIDSDEGTRRVAAIDAVVKDLTAEAVKLKKSIDTRSLSDLEMSAYNGLEESFDKVTKDSEKITVLKDQLQRILNGKVQGNAADVYAEIQVLESSLKSKANFARSRGIDVIRHNLRKRAVDPTTRAAVEKLIDGKSAQAKARAELAAAIGELRGMDRTAKDPEATTSERIYVEYLGNSAKDDMRKASRIIQEAEAELVETERNLYK